MSGLQANIKKNYKNTAHKLTYKITVGTIWNCVEWW